MHQRQGSFREEASVDPIKDSSSTGSNGSNNSSSGVHHVSFNITPPPPRNIEREHSFHDEHGNMITLQQKLEREKKVKEANAWLEAHEREHANALAAEHLPRNPHAIHPRHHHHHHQDFFGIEAAASSFTHALDAIVDTVSEKIENLQEEISPATSRSGSVASSRADSRASSRASSRRDSFSDLHEALGESQPLENRFRDLRVAVDNYAMHVDGPKSSSRSFPSPSSNGLIIL